MLGRIVGGNFRIEEKIGEGGMGAVYRAVDLMLEREVAVKAIRPDLTREPRIVERFKSEARILARLNHPAVATIYSFFEEGGELFLAMELVRGRSLAQVLEEEGAIPWRRAVPLFASALEGIEAAHRLGIVHRDLKPDNLMLTEAGKVKVMDFGIARMAGAGHLTRTGLLVGTLRYMAPEQIRGEEVDHRTDIYALGAVLYEILTGRVPFDGATDYAILKAQLEQPPPPPSAVVPDLPPWVEHAILRALEKDPATRFQSAEALRTYLTQTRATTLPAAGTLVEELPTLVLPRSPAATPAVVSPETVETGRTREPASLPTAGPVAAATSYRPVGPASWKPLAVGAALAVAVVAAGVAFWPRDPVPVEPAAVLEPTQEPDSPAEPTPEPTPAATLAAAQPLPVAPARREPPPLPVREEPAPRETSPEPEPVERAPEPQPVPEPVRQQPAEISPEPSSVDSQAETLQGEGEALEAASNRLIEVYKAFLDEKDEAGAEITEADEVLEEEIEEMIAAAERFNGAFRAGFISRLRNRTPGERLMVQRRVRELTATGQRVETLMATVQPNAEVRRVWTEVKRRWRRIAALAEDQ